MKEGAEDFPPKLRISDAEISNPTKCVEKLEGIGKKVRNRGEAVGVEMYVVLCSQYFVFL